MDYASKDIWPNHIVDNVEIMKKKIENKDLKEMIKECFIENIS